jgi:hypothetical protein
VKDNPLRRIQQGTRSSSNRPHSSMNLRNIINIAQYEQDQLTVEVWIFIPGWRKCTGWTCAALAHARRCYNTMSLVQKRDCDKRSHWVSDIGPHLYIVEVASKNPLGQTQMTEETVETRLPENWWLDCHVSCWNRWTILTMKKNDVQRYKTCVES